MFSKSRGLHIYFAVLTARVNMCKARLYVSVLNVIQIFGSQQQTNFSTFKTNFKALWPQFWIRSSLFYKISCLMWTGPDSFIKVFLKELYWSKFLFLKDINVSVNWVIHILFFQLFIFFFSNYLPVPTEDRVVGGYTAKVSLLTAGECSANSRKAIL